MSKECSAMLTVCDEHQQRVTAELRALREKVFGNGQPGLLSDMRSMQSRIAHVEETSADNNRRLVKIERLIWALGGASAVLQVVLKKLI